MEAFMKPATANPPCILVADDQPSVLQALHLLLKGENFEVQTVSTPSALIEAVTGRELDAVLMDLNYARDTTSGEEGLDLLTRLQAMDNTLPVVVMTAWGSVELAVEAMQRGARDFIQKPWDNTRLLTILRSQVALARALREGQRLEDENRRLRQGETPSMISTSPAMVRVIELIHRVAPSDAAVLITGEHGTGKEVAARTLHALSKRAAGPLVTVDAGSIPEGVFESELFGHVKGSFTDAKSDRAGQFEFASRGTLFLDEIANVPISQQAKLLRAIESGEVRRVGSSKTSRVDVRLVAATNANLQEEVAAGRFREDLLFRINTVEIHLPPLCERVEDILPLAHFFLSRFRGRYRKTVAGFDAAAEQALRSYNWPGNVRELNHAVERAVLMAQGSEVTAADLGLGPSEHADSRGRVDGLPLEEVEKSLIEKSIARYSGNISRAAQALGLSRSALYRRLEKYGIKSGDS